ncbi:MAG: NAD(P)H-quinone oxidoreductase [Vulcanimicrobiaceae bacterium]
MRAAVYTGTGGTEVIAVRDDVPDPVCGDEDALIDVAYAGLNRADILERQGRYPMPPRSPAIAGLEFSGTVAAVGAHVTNVAIGKCVFGLVAAGAHASRVAVHALTLATVPKDLDLQTAAAIPEAYVTAHDALFARARFALGEIALVHAVGSSVGLAAIDLVKRAGGIAIGTSRTPDKLARARDRGCDAGVVLDDEWVDGRRDATGGRGADVVLDFVGGPMLDRDLAALAPRGRIVAIGTLGGTRATLDLGQLLGKRAEVHGTVLRSRPLEERIALARTFSRDLLPLFARGELRTTIDRVFALSALGDAHAHMERDANFGKILIEIGGAPST